MQLRQRLRGRRGRTLRVPGSAQARRPAPGCCCHHPWLRPGRVVVYDRVWGTSAIGPVDTAIAGRAPRLTAAWRSSRLDAAGRGGRRAGTDGRQSIHPPARPSEAVKFSGTGTCQLTVTFSDRLQEVWTGIAGACTRSGSSAPEPASWPSRFPGRRPRTAGGVGRHQRRQTRVDPRRRQRMSRLGAYAIVDVDIDYEGDHQARVDAGLEHRHGGQRRTRDRSRRGPCTPWRAAPAPSGTLWRTYRGERRKTDRGSDRNRARPPARTPDDSRPEVPPAVRHHRRIGIRRDRRGALALTAAAFRVRVGPAPKRHVQRAWGAGQRRPGRGVSRQQTRRPGPAPAARPARRGVPDGTDRIGPPTLIDPRGSVILQSARDVRLTNAPAGRNGASSRDRRRRRGLRRVAAAAWAEPVEMSARQQREPLRKRPQQQTGRLAEALGMVIDDGLVNRLAHMHARINRDLVDTQRAAGPRVTLRRAERKAHRRRAGTAAHRAGGCAA